MVQQKETDSKGSFYLEQNGERLAIRTFSKAGTDRIIIDHTEVSEQHKGEGLGKQLVLAAVEYAREKKISIIPLCRFAKAVFESNEELRDVL